MSKNRGLWLGDNYPGQSCALAGCVNDVGNTRTALTGLIPCFGRKTLLDRQCTRKAILDGLEWLFDGAKPGDWRWLHYSGHGTTFIDPDESDGVGEALVPFDFDTAGPITDDDIDPVFAAIPAGVNVAVLMDSCFSGGMGSTRYRAMNVRGRCLHVGHIVGRGHKHISRKLIKVPGELPIAMLAASGEGQTSADAYIDSKSQGAGTYAFLRAWKRDPMQSLSQIVQGMNAWLAASGYDQRAQAAGNARNRQPFVARTRK